MRPMLLALGTLALATACSGGSPIPSASTSPSSNGAQYTYMRTTYGVAPGVNGKPMPIPTSSASELSVITTNASFASMHGLIRIARTNGGAHGTSTSYDYYAMAKSNGVTRFEQVGASGMSESQLNNRRFAGQNTMTLTTPFVVVEMPFSAGRTWSRSAAYSDVYDQRSNHPAVRINGQTVYDADGSYSLVATGAEGGQTLRSRSALASDGSYQSQYGLGSCRVTDDVGAPVMQAAKYVIPYAMSAKGCPGAPAPVATTLPDWYPGGALPPSPLRSANAVDMGAAAIPASCGVAPSIATRGEKIVVTSTGFNPLGTVGHGTETSYFATGIGLVCTESVAISQLYLVQPPAAKRVGRSVIYTVRSLVGYTKGSDLGAPVGLGSLQERAVVVRVGGEDRIP